MSSRAGEWRDDLDAIDAAIVDGYQSGFPVTERPFAAVAADLGIDESTAIDRVRRLRDAGVLRRFGAVLNPPVIGSSTLAALCVPEDRFDEVAEVVNGYRQVNHNYAREHEWNMWFVVTAGSREVRDRIVDEIGDRTGLTPLVLPMLTDYYIDLEFPVVNADRFARESLGPSPTAIDESSGEGVGSVATDATAAVTDRGPAESATDTDASATRISESAAADLSALDRRVLLSIQDGLALSPTPYRDLADSVDADVSAVLATVSDLLESGCIKRIGCIVDHVHTGFDSNCMVVWDVPDEDLDRRGEVAGSLPYVTLCYHRPRRPAQDWPYNLFTMIHGRESSAVDGKIDELAAEYLPYDHDRLYSTQTLKQTGARYEDLVGD